MVLSTQVYLLTDECEISDRRKAKLRRSYYNFTPTNPGMQYSRKARGTLSDSSSEEDTPQSTDRRIKVMLNERLIFLR